MDLGRHDSKIFDKAGMDLDEGLNKVRVPGHKGPHPELYHSTVFDRLVESTRDLTGDAYKQALELELQAIGTEAKRQGTLLNLLLTEN